MGSASLTGSTEVEINAKKGKGRQSKKDNPGQHLLTSQLHAYTWTHMYEIALGIR